MKGKRHRTDTAVLEVEFEEISEEQLNPLIDYLAELLTEERLRELEQAEEVEKQ